MAWPPFNASCACSWLPGARPRTWPGAQDARLAARCMRLAHARLLASQVVPSARFERAMPSLLARLPIPPGGGIWVDQPDSNRCCRRHKPKCYRCTMVNVNHTGTPWLRCAQSGGTCWIRTSADSHRRFCKPLPYHSANAPDRLGPPALACKAAGLCRRGALQPQSHRCHDLAEHAGFEPAGRLRDHGLASRCLGPLGQCSSKKINHGYCDEATKN